MQIVTSSSLEMHSLFLIGSIATDFRLLTQTDQNGVARNFCLIILCSSSPTCKREERHVSERSLIRKAIMACLCLGPISSGKTLLLKRLQNPNVNETTATVETVGTNLIAVSNRTAPAKNEKENKKKSRDERDCIGIREVGGSMAALWPSYYSPGKPVMYVIDSSNLFQVSISTVLLMQMLSHEKLVGSKFLIVLGKHDLTNRKKLNHLKFMMRLDNIVSQAGSRITVEEASAISGEGIEKVRKWIVENCGTLPV